MSSQQELIKERVFYARQDLRKLFGGREFVIRVIIDKGHIRVHIRPKFKSDLDTFTLDQQEEIRKISERYSNYEALCPWDEMQMQKAVSQ